MKRILSVCLVITILLIAIPVSTMALSQYGYVTGGWLRLRSSASFDSSTINSYYTGTAVKILGTSGSWYQVEAPDGKTGYMYSSYITFSGGGGGTGTAYVTSSNGLGVRLRTGPGTGYSIIGVFSVGTAVTILQSGSTWDKIQIGSSIGYMMSKFLTTSGGGGGTAYDTATIWSANGYGVRLRSGPSTSYSIIGVYSVGTVVTVKQHNTTWDYISVGSRSGYMMNEFLHYYSSSTVSAVTLNNTTPVVGSTLSVAAITPSTATVTYGWYVGTTLAATTSTYTVTSADVGYQIKLVVTGYGSYTGTATSALTSTVVEGTAVTGVTLNNTSPVVGDVLGAASVTPLGATVSYQWYASGTLVSTASYYTVTSANLGQYISLQVTGSGIYTGTATATSANVVQASGTITALNIQNLTNASTTGVNAPNVSDILKAVPDPVTATGTYRWYLDGDTASAPLSYLNTLAVTTAMVGHTVTAYCTGTNNYSGNPSYSTGIIVNKPNITSLTLSPSTPHYVPSDTAASTLTATAYYSTTDVSSSCTFQWYRNGVAIVGATSQDYLLDADDDVGQMMSVSATANSTGSYSGTLTRTAAAVVRRKIQTLTISGSTSLTPDHVKVGDVLAPVLDGGLTGTSAVIATYTWTLNGASSNTLAYTVPSGNVAGKTLTLTVVGKGDYYTDAPLTASVTVDATEITAAAITAQDTVAGPTAGETLTASLTPASATATYSWVGTSGHVYTGSPITILSGDIGGIITLTVTPGEGYTATGGTIVTTSAVVAPQTFTASLWGTFAVGSTISINTDLPTASIDSISWYLGSTGSLYHAGTEKSIVLPTSSSGYVVRAYIVGKGNYTGSTKDITSEDPIAATAAGATTVSLTSYFEDPAVVESDAFTTETVTPTESVEPEVSTEPTESTEPTVSTEPTESTAPDVTTESTESVTSVETTEPTVSTEPDATSDSFVSADTQEEPANLIEDAPVEYSVTFHYSSSSLSAGTVVTAVLSTEDSGATYLWSMNDTPLSTYGNQYTIQPEDVSGTSKLSVQVTFTSGATASYYTTIPASE